MRIADGKSVIEWVNASVAHTVTPYYIMKHLNRWNDGYSVNCVLDHKLGNKLFLLTDKFRIVIYKFCIYNYTVIIETLI